MTTPEGPRQSFKFAVDPPAGLAWQKSSLSAESDCVEVATHLGVVFVRDSEDTEGPVLRFTAAQWACFVRSAEAGEFNF
jgi:hypothetical protein